MSVKTITENDEVKVNPSVFVKEVAKYFMDFLETDHKRETS